MSRPKLLLFAIFLLLFAGIAVRGENAELPSGGFGALLSRDGSGLPPGLCITQGDTTLIILEGDLPTVSVRPTSTSTPFNSVYQSVVGVSYPDHPEFVVITGRGVELRSHELNRIILFSLKTEFTEYDDAIYVLFLTMDDTPGGYGTRVTWETTGGTFTNTTPEIVPHARNDGGGWGTYTWCGTWHWIPTAEIASGPIKITGEGFWTWPEHRDETKVIGEVEITFERTTILADAIEPMITSEPWPGPELLQIETASSANYYVDMINGRPSIDPKKTFKLGEPFCVNALFGYTTDAFTVITRFMNEDGTEVLDLINNPYYREVLWPANGGEGRTSKPCQPITIEYDLVDMGIEPGNYTILVYGALYGEQDKWWYELATLEVTILPGEDSIWDELTITDVRLTPSGTIGYYTNPSTKERLYNPFVEFTAVTSDGSLRSLDHLQVWFYNLQGDIMDEFNVYDVNWYHCDGGTLTRGKYIYVAIATLHGRAYGPFGGFVTIEPFKGGM